MSTKTTNVYAKYMESMAPTLAWLARYQDSMAPTLRYIQSLQDSAAPMLATAKMIQDSMAPTLATIKSLQDSMAPTLATIKSLQDSVAPTLTWLQEMQADWRRRLNQLAPEKRKVMAYLARRGWYLPPETPLWDSELAGLVDADDVAEVDKHMAEQIDALLDTIVAAASECAPRRAHLIQDAAWAYREGRYSLSIPLVLAQTGAICLEVVGVEAWAKERETKKPRTAKKVQQYVEQLDEFGPDAFFLPDLLPVLEGTSMLENTSDRDAKRVLDPTYGPLNRHGVLHGVDTDFGTRENALRAFAALGYYAGLPDLLGPVASRGEERQIAG